MNKHSQKIENYHYYLGSACLRNYEESVNHCKSEAAYLREEGYWDIHIPNSTSGGIKENQSALATELSIIDSGLGNSLGCMRLLGIHYEALSSLDLLLSANTASFRYNVKCLKNLINSCHDYATKTRSPKSKKIIFSPI